MIVKKITPLKWVLSVETDQKGSEFVQRCINVVVEGEVDGKVKTEFLLINTEVLLGFIIESLNLRCPPNLTTEVEKRIIPFVRGKVNIRTKNP